MKKLVFLVIVITMGLFSSISYAQFIGVRGGVGISNLLTPSRSSVSYGRVFSAHLGGTIDFDLADRFYLQSGLTFFKKGAATSRANFNLYYLELPITARFDFLEIGGEGSLYARAGFYTGFAMFGKFDGIKLDIGNKVGDDFKALDVGFITGVGYAFNESIDVGIMAEFGFLNIEPDNDLTSLTNAAFMMSVNYRFGM